MGQSSTTTMALVAVALGALGAGCKDEAQGGEHARAPAARDAAAAAATRDAAAATPVADAGEGAGKKASGGHADAAAADLGPPAPDLVAPPASAQVVALARQPWEGLDRPVLLTYAPGDPARRRFIVEQVGRIRVVEGDTLVAAAVLDLTGLVSRGNEQGLLGLAFHPRFADNHKLYVDYTDRDGDTRIVEYVLATDGASRVDPASARELLKIKQPYSNHNGGHILFGVDGKLYVGMGDGGDAGDPHGNGQSDRSQLGKLLRLDVDDPAAKPQVVAKGLRNPWRFAFDPASGDFYVGDVGQDAWESVYAVAAAALPGANFGWNVAEGRHCYRKKSCDRTGFVTPVADYPHPEGCSVTGGVVYRGRALPALAGTYFYADYCTALLRSFRWRNDGIRQHWDWKPVLDPDAKLAQISSFGLDADGEIYLISLFGDIYELVPRT